jgi:hypothetical protein
MVNQTWPRKVSAKVGALESTIQTSATDFRTWSAMGSLTRGEAYTKVLADANQVSHVADILRRSLGLPPP